MLTYVTEVDLSQILGSEHSERVAALHLQLTGSQAQVAVAEQRLERLVVALEQGANVPHVVQRINELQAEIETLHNAQLPKPSIKMQGWRWILQSPATRNLSFVSRPSVCLQG